MKYCSSPALCLASWYHSRERPANVAVHEALYYPKSTKAALALRRTNTSDTYPQQTPRITILKPSTQFRTRYVQPPLHRSTVSAHCHFCQPPVTRISAITQHQCACDVDHVNEAKTLQGIGTRYTEISTVPYIKRADRPTMMPR